MKSLGKLVILLSAWVGMSHALAAQPSQSYQGTWTAHDSTAIFHSDNRGPIPYEKCGVSLEILQNERKLLIQAVKVDCSVTDDMPFSHEIYALEFDIQGTSLLENGQKVGTITDKLISLDHAAETYDGTYYIDVDRDSSGALQFSWAFTSDIYQGFEVKGLLRRSVR